MFLLFFFACSRDPSGATPLVRYTEDRAPCADRAEQRQLLWGDLHVHGAFSFDAANYQTTATAEQIYAFARGAPLALPPLDEAGQGTRVVQLDRPLDFAALSEHGEFLGELLHCTTPGETGYDSERCAPYQGGEANAAFDFGTLLAAVDPTRPEEICGPDGTGCAEAAAARWAELVAATEAADDKSSDCAFSAFVSYEYTNSTLVTNLHRNVLFRNAAVPALPVTTFEAPDPATLWAALQAKCRLAGTGCDVMVIPHNSNLSNGQMFDASGLDPALAALRGQIEPVVEIFQHKGSSECRNGYGDPDDPDCDFEQLRPPDDEVCPDGQPGEGGMRNWGCTGRLDVVRNTWKEGLRLQRELGVNPYHFGVVAATDTHNGTPGLVRSVDFPGHIGVVDATPEDRLGEGNITHDAFLNNPGGLAAVWAVENSRDAIFEALRRGESFATSGPRIALRFFGGPALPEGLCGQADPVAAADAAGVPMGGALAAGGAPRFLVWAEADAGTEQYPGVGLSRAQIVKGWLNADGQLEEQVVELEVSAEAAHLDTASCEASGGAAVICATWQDPDFDASEPAFYYARVLEVPTCRWSTRECNAFPEGERPPRCDDPGHVQPVVEQRAWSSPIWTGEG